MAHGKHRIHVHPGVSARPIDRLLGPLDRFLARKPGEIDRQEIGREALAESKRRAARRINHRQAEVDAAAVFD